MLTYLWQFSNRSESGNNYCRYIQSVIFSCNIMIYTCTVQKTTVITIVTLNNNEVTTQSFCPCLFSHAIKFSVNLNSSLWSNSNKSSNLGIRFFESLSLNLKSVLLLLYKTVLDILTWDRNIYTVQCNPVMGVYVQSGIFTFNTTYHV